MSKKKEDLITWVFVSFVVVGFLLGFMYFSRFFNAATLHTQVINPKPNVECVVVSATDSTSVDCWKTN